MTDEIQAFDEQEFDEAVAEAKAESSTAYVHHFKRPFEYNGKTYENLTFDFRPRLFGAYRFRRARTEADRRL